ncbi:MAG: vanadium-dependent haloperoxidase, partial [Pseudomonadota bacterium]
MRQKSISRAPGATPRWLPNPVKAWRAGLAIALLWAPSPALAASVVTEWTETLLEEMVLTHPEPTSASRMAAIVYTAMYDAWAAYDPVAVGAITANTLDGTGGEATEANRAEAMSHAAFHTLSLLARRKNPSIDQMDALDFEVGDTSLPAILGRRVAAAVMDVRRTDGANHVHFYQDTSNYMIAPPSDLASWQPIVFENMLQEPTTPHWDRVTPFALPSPDALRPPPPPRPGSAAFEAEVTAIMAYREQLTAQHKAIAEYWLPHGGTPASHLIHLTEELSEDRAWTLEEDIKTFFVVANALLDAGIAAWDAKYHYNFVRPETALADIKFRPYLDTPPFPEYVSGHSAFTAAWAAALEGVTGSPEYGYTTRVQILREGNRVLLSGRTLSFPTFWSAAESSGQSRLYGGIHWPVSNTEGLALGRAAGEAA